MKTVSKLTLAILALIVAVLLGAGGCARCSEGAVCVSGDNNAVGPNPAPTAKPSASPSPSPSPTPDPSSFDDLVVSWKGGAQIGVLAQDEQIDVTPTFAGKEVDKKYNTKRVPTYNVLTPTFCTVVNAPGTTTLDYNPILRPLAAGKGRVCALSVSMLDAARNVLVTAQPFNVTVQ